MNTASTKRTTTKTKKTTNPSTAAPVDINTLAAQALASIAGVLASIPLDNVTTAQANAARVANIVPAAAVNIAANVLEQNPTLFSAFIPSVITDALQYEQAVGPLLVQVEHLKQRLSSTLLARKGDAASQTLALYAAMKALSRLSEPPALAAAQADLAKLLSKKRPSRATSVTVPEAASAVRAVRATKVATKKAAIANKAIAVSNAAAADATRAAGGALSAVPPAPTSVAPATPASSASH